MSFTVSFNGTTYTLPNVGNRLYAANINTFLTAVANNALAKSGGTFTLTADVNFGATYGVVAKYFKSVSSNISATGVVRLANNEGLGWRDASNSADKILKLDSGNRLEIDGVDLVTVSSTDTLTNKTLTSPVINSPTGLVKADVGLGNVDNTSDATKNAASVTLTNKTISGSSNTLTNIAASSLASTTGSGAVVLATSPTLVTPALGTPSAVVLTSATGLPLTTGVTGTLPIANGGSGQTTANAALNAFLPSQASASNKYLKSDGTNTSWASASGGAGEINAILNASGADGTTGWTGTTVVSGSSSPLNPIVTTAHSIANSATTESSTSGGYYPFTMPSGLLNRKLKVEFTFTTPATDVWRVSVYQGSTRVALSTDSSSVTTLPASVTGGKFTAYFDTDSSTSWTLSVTRTSGSTGACYITNVIVGPGIQPQGAVVGEWTLTTASITSSGGGSVSAGTGGSASSAMSYRRVGDAMECALSWRFGTSSPSFGTGTTYRIQLPLGLSYNAAVIQTANISNSVGAGRLLDNSAATIYNVSVSAGNTNQTYVYMTPLSGTNIDIGPTSPFTFAADDQINVTFTVPIAEWAGSGTVNLAQNDVEYAYNTSTADSDDTTSFGYGPTGQAFGAFSTATRSKRVRFQTPIQTGDKLEMEILRSGSWIPVENSEFMSLNSTTGMMLIPVNSTDCDVKFGSAGISSTINGGGAAWSALSSYKWRVRKSSAGAAVGFGIVVPGTSSGLVSASGLPGRTSGTTIAAGYVGELLANEATVGPTAATLAGVPFNVGSISLTAGTWIVYGQGILLPGTATGNTYLLFELNTTSATLRDSSTLTRLGIIGRLGNTSTGCLPLIVNVSSNQTVYAIGQYDFSVVGTSVMRAALTAVRIA